MIHQFDIYLLNGIAYLLGQVFFYDLLLQFITVFCHKKTPKVGFLGSNFWGSVHYNVSIPTTILLWVMTYPMMLKIDFKSIKDIGKNPKGLFITWFVN